MEIGTDWSATSADRMRVSYVRMEVLWEGTIRPLARVKAPETERDMEMLELSMGGRRGQGEVVQEQRCKASPIYTQKALCSAFADSPLLYPFKLKERCGDLTGTKEKESHRKKREGVRGGRAEWDELASWGGGYRDPRHDQVHVALTFEQFEPPPHTAHSAASDPLDMSGGRVDSIASARISEPRKPLSDSIRAAVDSLLDGINCQSGMTLMSWRWVTPPQFVSH